MKNSEVIMKKNYSTRKHSNSLLFSVEEAQYYDQARRLSYSAEHGEEIELFDIEHL